MHQLLGAVNDAVLAGSFDPGTLSRARGYAAGGNVLATEVVEGDLELEILASVRGNRVTPYQVHVLLECNDRGGIEVETDCSCPVGLDCKHGCAALIVASRRMLGTLQAQHPWDRMDVSPAWQRDLDAVLADLEVADRPPTARKELALGVELTQPSRARYATSDVGRVVLRPLMEGARNNWVKRGIDWRQVQYVARRDEFLPEQFSLLNAFAAIFTGGYLKDNVDLADAGPTLWSLLARARESGLDIVPGGLLSEIEVRDEPVELTADLLEDPEGNRVVLGVREDNRVHSGEALRLVGTPAHGVGFLVGQPRARRLVLAPLTRTLPSSLQRLHQRGSLTVPTQARESFERDYLPRLRDRVPVTSSDGSFDIPGEPPPRLRLRVEWRSSTEVSLTWAWVYDTDDGERLVDLDEREPDGHDVRRLGQERRILQQLELDDLATSALCDVIGRPAPHRVLEDVWALLFADTVLPGLREQGQVEIVQVGEVPDYREASGEPEIEFLLDGSDGDGDGTGDGDGGGDSEEKDDHNDWLDLEVVITIDGERVPLPVVLEALTKGIERIILPSGLHISMDRPEFRRLAELIHEAGELAERTGEGVRVGRHDLGLWGELAELGIVDAQAAQWVEAARALRGDGGLPDVEPTDLKSELRSYQLEGFRWLVQLWRTGLGGILADDMGLGKTLQTLALIAHARAEGAAPFLVVAPTSVMGAWAHEAATHTPGLDVRIIDASERRRGVALADAVEGADLVVTSYTLFRIESEDYADLEWGGLVLDEAQAIKNHQGKTYQAVRKLEVPFRLAVTGTPFENRLMELWALLSVVAPGLYPWPRRFVDQVVKPVEKGGDQSALERFRRRIRPFLLRRTKEVVAADLPAKQEQVIDVALGAKHRRVYDTHLQRERQAILGLVQDFDKNRVAIFRALTKLRQLSLDAGLVDAEYDALGSAKLDVLVDHVAAITAEGHRALVFSQFTGFLARARERLASEGVTTRYLDGSTRDREREIAAFKAGEADAFLISLKAGGVGLTLTEADYVFVLDPWWNPAAEAQAVDRAHRIGQERPVMVYRLVAADTIEEKVMELKERKAALFASVFDGEGAVGAGIDADDVRSLFDD